MIATLERPKVKTVPSIYVACLSAYNNGLLHGDWIDCDQDPDDIQAEIDEILNTSPCREYEACEDWAIHDSEGFGKLLSECESIEYISALGNALYDFSDSDALESWFGAGIESCEKSDIEAMVEEFRDRFLGHWDNEEDFTLKSEEANEVTGFDQLEKDNHFLSLHIDWKELSDTLFVNNFHSEKAHPHGIYVFRNSN